MGLFSRKPKAEPEPINGWQPYRDMKGAIRVDPDGMPWSISQMPYRGGGFRFKVLRLTETEEMPSVFLPRLEASTLKQTIANANAEWARIWPDEDFE